MAVHGCEISISFKIQVQVQAVKLVRAGTGLTVNASKHINPDQVALRKYIKSKASNDVLNFLRRIYVCRTCNQSMHRENLCACKLQCKPARLFIQAVLRGPKPHIIVVIFKQTVLNSQDLSSSTRCRQTLSSHFLELSLSLVGANTVLWSFFLIICKPQGHCASSAGQSRSQQCSSVLDSPAV